MPTHRLPLRLKLLYSTGDLTTSAPLAIVAFFQLYFLTDVAGLRPDYAAWAVAAGRLWDAVNDPLFGMFSDRLRSRWGRRRVLLLFGAVPLGLAFGLMWLVPPLPPAGLAAYYAVVFILFDTAYTAVHVGYNALTPELTEDYDERSALNGFRMVYAIGGALGAVILATVLGWVIPDARALFAGLGLGLGLLAIAPPLIVFRVTAGRESPAPAQSLPALAGLRATLRNFPFWMVTGLYLLSWTTASLLSAVLVYFASYYLRVPEQANYFVLAAQAAAIAFVPLSVWLARRLDKRRAFIIGMAAWGAAALGIAALPPDQVALAYGLAVFSGLGIATAYVLPWAMVPDIIEHDQLRTGERREGSYYAFIAFFQKLGTGAALWLVGQALAWAGYVTPAAGAVVEQPPQAVQAIRAFAGPVPAALLLGAVLFAWAYPITRASHQATVAELAGRDG
ncbi:MAG: MFS transporter [Anaerolineales bacterium]|nr:MFS transporter [Anaerolineales bacterium]